MENKCRRSQCQTRSDFECHRHTLRQLTKKSQLVYTLEVKQMLLLTAYRATAVKTTTIIVTLTRSIIGTLSTRVTTAVSIGLILILDVVVARGGNCFR
jgi:hypothetical protein